MSQPVGIFIGLSQPDLDALRANALARVGGQVISVSEAGQSYAQSSGMDPKEVLREVQYAEKVNSGRPIIRTTRPDFSRARGGYGYGGGSDLGALERGGEPGSY